MESPPCIFINILPFIYGKLLTFLANSDPNTHSNNHLILAIKPANPVNILTNYILDINKYSISFGFLHGFPGVSRKCSLRIFCISLIIQQPLESSIRS